MSNDQMNNPEEVKKFMDDLKYPLKDEVVELRKIIRSAGPDLDEQIKWSAPSFSHKGEYIVTLNLFANDKVRLVFHNPRTPEVKSDIWEGDFKDGRRLVTLLNMNDVKEKKAEIERVVRELIKLTDK